MGGETRQHSRMTSAGQGGQWSLLTGRPSQRSFSRVCQDAGRKPLPSRARCYILSPSDPARAGRLFSRTFHRGQAMARGINKVILIGNLGRDPETRYSQGGNPITSFSVATSENWRRSYQSGEQQERTEWHNVVCFGAARRDRRRVPEERIQGLHRRQPAHLQLGAGRPETLPHRGDGAGHADA